MTVDGGNITVDRSRGAEPVRVWDTPTRLFHWSLAALVTAGILTGYVSPEWWMGIHSWAGYGIVLLVVFRMVWGLFGAEYSRVTNFAYSPTEAARHLRGLMMMRPAHYIGHNPTGAMMIFTLIAVLVGVTTTGLLVLGGEENHGPLAGVTSYPIGDAAKVVHGYLVVILMVMIAGHVLGVIATSVMTRENLVRAMIDGKKLLPAGVRLPEPRKARPAAAALTFGAFVLVAGAVLGAVNRIPPTGHRLLPVHADFETECSECHQLYHPSLLPEASWRGLMRNLEDHFGEDASLDEDTARAIETFLADYAGETWDTEASNRFRRVSTEAPWRISATPYWVRKHNEISDDVYARKGIGAKSNCIACHLDAATGRFDDQLIHIVKED